MLNASKTLGCSVFELLEREDADYWLGAANVYGQYQSWVERRAHRRQSAR